MAAKRENHEPAILAALPGTSQQLVERTGLSRSTISRWLTKMRHAKLIHISSWKTHGEHGELAGKPAAYWAVGAELARPVPRPSKRLLALPVRVVVPARRDPLVAAFFGEANGAVCADG